MQDGCWAGRHADGLGEIELGDGRAVREQQHPLHQVLKLADIPGPRVDEEPPHRRLVDAFNLLVQPLVVLLDEVQGEGGDVGCAVAQRGQADGDHREPVVEVLAEAAGLDLGVEVPVGGGNQPHVHPCGLDAADPLELTLLEGAEQLHLHLDGDFSNLIEEERAPVCELEASGLGGHGTGEGAALVAEELGLHQVLGNGGAVDFNERLGAATAAFVERGRDEFLAGAALAGDEDRGGGVRDLVDDFIEVLHLRRLTDEGRPRASIRLDPFLRALPGLEGLRDHGGELGLVEGLGDVVERADFDGLHRGVHGAVGGDDDDRDLGGERVDGLQQLEPSELWHHQVGDHDVGAILLELGQALLAILCDRDVEAVATQHGRQDLAQIRLVIDHQHLRHGTRIAEGE